MGKMTIYSSGNDSKEFDGACADLRDFHQGPLGIGQNWNDAITHISVESGEWRLFEHVNFQGESHVFGPGSHFDDFLRRVSSFTVVG